MVGTVSSRDILRLPLMVRNLHVGKWIGAAPLPDYDLQSREDKLHGDEKQDFLRFLRRALCWLPEERATAKELLFDPWMMHGLRLKKPADGDG